ncbi:MAG: 8-amino-7-oxononanoate synthase [Candidatus Omnitrophica bacterium]|nr:8-amino-7-oxononanoate synthase [Candidatus Omnitrophota bacterium]MDD5352945.1 8-amino-7-oxononanoate synthase [Candidatus Omnitrophota bacterium]MDD5550544.1 8-amino-7-oxononanoate synthase [Candidatus Omnitrophota bacterium]
MFDFKKELLDLEEKRLRRQLKTLESQQDSWFVVDGKRVLNLCSNNYLGLANDKRIKKASISAIKKYGCGSGASRLVCGNMILHKELEEKIAKFKKTESALVFNSGYTANLGIISALVGRGDVVFCDKLNHASIIDAIILSRTELRRYPHKDSFTLEELIKKSENFNKKLIVTDSVFSMDGDIAALKDLINLSKKYNCLLMIDEAHATGVLGKNGRGALEYLGLENEKENIIQMGTLSKAFGGFGAYVCGSKDLIEYLINKSRAFIYTTALPPAVIAANIKALEIVQSSKNLRIKLKKNISFFKNGLKFLGFSVTDDETPIIPLIIGDAKLTMEFSKKLFKERIFVQGIRPPTVPQGLARLRITLMATHTKKDLEFALAKIKKVAKELCLI